MDTGNKTWYGNAAGPYPSLQGRGSLCAALVCLFVGGMWLIILPAICVCARSFFFVLMGPLKICKC